MKREIAENKNIAFWMENGILYGVYKKNSIIDLPAAEEIVEMRLAFTKGKSFPGLVDGRNIGNVIKQAREYLADEGCKGITKGALQIGSNWSRILANLFLHINKPVIPMKVFTDKQEAEKWLKTSRKKLFIKSILDKFHFLYFLSIIEL